MHAWNLFIMTLGYIYLVSLVTVCAIMAVKIAEQRRMNRLLAHALVQHMQGASNRAGEVIELHALYALPAERDQD